MTGNTCPLCNQPAQNNGPSPLGGRDGGQTHWDCQTCGTFRIGDSACRLLERDRALQEKRFLLSAYTKQGADVLIDADLLDQPGQGFPRERTVPEKMELVLQHFADKSKEYGQQVGNDPDHDYPIGWCRSAGEWTKLIETLIREREFMKVGLNSSGPSVTMKGWEWLGARPGEVGKTAFVAMNFDEKYQDLQKEIERAIRGAGYEPKVASKDLYAGGVMDWVLAQIREARFVVADYTGNRGGVYYEAGFALGLGKTVIHSCRKQMLDPSDKDDRLHFDVAHLKVIPWNDDDLSTYSADLQNHILAVFGRGPVKPQPLP